MKSCLLALETSSSVCDVAVLCRDGGPAATGGTAPAGGALYAASHDATGEHAERLLPMVDEVLERAGLKPADLVAVAFGQGPGGFTGLRVACGVAQGLGFGLGVPVIPVPSLLAVAWRAHDALARDEPGAAGPYVVVQDARMNEVYLAVYEPPASNTAGWRTLQPPMLMDAGAMPAWLAQTCPDWGLAPPAMLWVCGDALDTVLDRESLVAAHPLVRLAGSWRADASAVARLGLAALDRGETVAPEAAMPLYVRDKVAFTTQERRDGAGGNPRAPGLAVTLHPMQPEHLDDVAAIEARVQSFPWTRRNFADGLAAGYPAIVARQAGRIVGFYMVMLAPDVAHLLVIAVDPAHQGKGTGKRLMQHCEALARRHGLDTVVLEVRFSNDAAMGFYRHLGFETFTVRKDYYPAARGTREHANVMKKTLSLDVRHDD